MDQAQSWHLLSSNFPFSETYYEYLYNGQIEIIHDVNSDLQSQYKEGIFFQFLKLLKAIIEPAMLLIISIYRRISELKSNPKNWLSLSSKSVNESTKGSSFLACENL